MNIIIGPPGTGKTATLINLVEKYLDQGTRPDQIGFLAFTKKAAHEAQQRAVTKFGLSEKDLPYFRTIHSLAFRQLALSKVQVMQREHYRELGNILGLDIDGYVNMDEGSISYSMSQGDRYIFFEGLAKARRIPLRQQWEMTNEELDWFELDRVDRALVKYKEANGLMDFNNMLELFIKQGVLPKLKVLFIDEAQDLSTLQWFALASLIKNTEVIYVAGDDDQSIFRWSGADTNQFINLVGNTCVLDESFRVPKTVQRTANAIISSINYRRPKTWRSRKDDGAVLWHSGLETLPLETGEWLLLARNSYMLKMYEEHCLTNGFSFDGRYSPLKSPVLTAIRYWEQLRKGEELTVEQFKKIRNYTTQISAEKYRLISSYTKVTFDLATKEFKMPNDIWHKVLDKISPYEREYFIAARRRGETLIGKPRIKISTIHGAKGGEADNVCLITDLAPRTFNEMENNFDDECRVFYVGVTRAKNNLHLIQPHTNMSFQL